MKKMHSIAGILIVISMMAFLLCACGSKEFLCPFCMKWVKQKPHEVTIFGQQAEICNTCYQKLMK